MDPDLLGFCLGGLDGLLADLIEGALVEEGGVDGRCRQVLAGALQDDDARLDVGVEGARGERVAREEAVLAAEALEVGSVVKIVVEEVLGGDDGEEPAGLEEFGGPMQEEEFAAPVLPTVVERQREGRVADHHVDEGAGVVPGEVFVREGRLRVEVARDRESVLVDIAAVGGAFEVGVVTGEGVDERSMADSEVEDDLARLRVEQLDDLLGDAAGGEELAELALALVDRVAVVVAVVGAFEAVEAAEAGVGGVDLVGREAFEVALADECEELLVDVGAPVGGDVGGRRGVLEHGCLPSSRAG